MGIFVQDTFTGSAGALLTAHTGEIGGWVSRVFPLGGDNTLYTKLDGSGRVYAASRTTTSPGSGCSNVVAPQLDTYEAYSLVFGAVPTSSFQFSTVVEFFEHIPPSGDVPSNPGFSMFVNNSAAFVGIPAYIDANSGAPTSFALPTVAANSSHTARAEYFFSTGVFNYFWDGTLVCSLRAPDYTPNVSAPATPGVFGFGTRYDSTLTPMPIAIDYLELGTIDPPTAFWTDLTGSLVETIGA
jgi:hypothetical protein